MCIAVVCCYTLSIAALRPWAGSATRSLWIATPSGAPTMLMSTSGVAQGPRAWDAMRRSPCGEQGSLTAWISGELRYLLVNLDGCRFRCGGVRRSSCRAPSAMPRTIDAQPTVRTSNTQPCVPSGAAPPDTLCVNADGTRVWTAPWRRPPHHPYSCALDWRQLALVASQ